MARDRGSGEHDGQVGLDRLPLVVEDRPRAPVGRGHPEGLLHLPEIVIGLDHDACPSLVEAGRLVT
jgi:hypothetical protein